MALGLGLPYLVRRVRYAYIEAREIHANHVPEEYFETIRTWGALDPFRNLSSHSRIQFDRDDFLCLFEDFDSQIASPRTDFKHDLEALSFKSPRVRFPHTSLCFKSALAIIASATDLDQQRRLTKAISIDLPPGFLSTCCPSVVFIYEIFQGPEDARFGWLLRTLKIWLAADVFPAVPYGEV